MKLLPNATRHGRFRFLLYFFVPVMLAVLFGAASSYYAFVAMRIQQEEIHRQQEADLNVLSETSRLAFDMLSLQQEVGQTLSLARAGKIDEAAAYQMHTVVVDRFALLDGRLKALRTKYEGEFVGDELGRAIEHFEAYRQFVIMATDIAAVDPGTAVHYIDRANERYVSFAEHAHAVDNAAAQLLLQHMSDTRQQLDDYSDKVLRFGLIASFTMIGLWLLVAMALTRRLHLLTHTLVRLAADDRADNDPLPEVASLAEQPTSLIGQMAHAVLAFREARTEREAAISALREREEIYSSIVNQAGSGILLIDLDRLGFVEFNDAACASLGYSRDEFSRLTLHDLQGAMTRDEVDRFKGEIFAAGGGEFESLQRKKDGSVREFWISLKALKLHGRDCLAGVWTDISERKQAERELAGYRAELEQLVAERTDKLEETARQLAREQTNLQATNDELRTILDSATVGIVLIRNRYILRCNRKLEEIFGYAPGQLAGKPTRAWYPDEEAYNELGHEAYDAAGTPGQLHQRSLELVRQDGSRFWARLTWRAFDTATTAGALICMVEDISVEREAAAALLRAKELAEEASRAKSAFLANMSHEIRTPMNAIIGLTHLAHRDATSDRQRQQLDKVNQAAHHLLGIINDILDFSKIEAGKMTLDATDFDVDRVIGNVCTLTHEKAEDKGLELVADIASLPPALHGDGLKLGQILLNFVGNAVKFTERGSVVLRGSVLRTEGETRWVRFEVRDTGIGLDQAQQARLFRAFEQADASTTRTYGGTGLGLAISDRLAELMGGRIGVSSEPGQGSVFWLEAPFGAVHGRQLRAAPSELTKGTRVLVVDDMEDAREVLIDTLVGFGLRADAASSGEAALQVIAAADAEADPYRMVLTDWKMGGIDGTEMARQLRLLPLGQAPICFLVSGSSGCPSGELQRGGFAAFIAKPVTPTVLLDAMTAALATQGAVAVEVPAGFDAGLRFRAGQQVLLAEDNELNQEVALDLLRHVGLNVDLADDGLAAVEQAKKRIYDLILMDIQMPLLDGLGATAQIRRLPGYAAVPILAMTANAFAEDRDAALAAGMNDYVAKPVDPELLYGTLMKWLPVEADGAPALPARRDTGAAAGRGAALRDSLSRLPGLNLDAALRPLRGDVLRLGDLLHRFAQDHRYDAVRLRAELAGDDRASALHNVHTLKGVAGTFGLHEVQTLAAALEVAIRRRDGAEEIDVNLQRLERSLEDCCVALGKLTVAAVPPRTSASPQPLRQQLEHLRALLRSDDLMASDVFESVRPALTELNPKTARRLALQVDEFSFEAALQTLDDLLNESGASLVE